MSESGKQLCQKEGAVTYHGTINVVHLGLEPDSEEWLEEE